MNHFTKDEYSYMNVQRRNALQAIAKKLGAGKVGKKHPAVEMMGSLAWGRHNYEQGPQPTLRTEVVEFGFLEGVRFMLMSWANHSNDYQLRRLLEEHWPLGMRTAKDEEVPS